MADHRGMKCIKHKLTRTDTLVSLALKYNVTVQDLKKENKIWNSDHLFLRETLLIPLTPDNESILDENDVIIIFDGSTSNAASPSSSQSDLPNGNDAEPSNHNREAATAASKARSHSTPSDFFSKYDSSIAQLKGDVAKMEQNAANIEGTFGSNKSSTSPRRGSVPSHRGSCSSASSASEYRESNLSDEDGNSSLVLVIRSLTHNKHVKSTIENLQQVNDDIYEL